MIQNRSRLTDKNFKTSWIIWGILIIIIVLTLLFVNETNNKWESSPISSNIHVYVNDTSIFKDSEIAPLTIILDNKEFVLKNSLINVFQIEIKPKEYKIKLKGNNGQILKIDTFYFEGTQHIHYYLRKFERLSDTLNIKTDIMNFYEL